MAHEPLARVHLILLIRHAEKPTPDGVVQGVDGFGKPSADELSVLGWQRAGALAALFAGADGRRPGLFEPSYLHAARPTPEAPSVRAVSTLQPLADLLGLPISMECAVGEERRLASMLSELDECALVAWEHKASSALRITSRVRRRRCPRDGPKTASIWCGFSSGRTAHGASGKCRSSCWRTTDHTSAGTAASGAARRLRGGPPGRKRGRLTLAQSCLPPPPRP